MSWLDGLIAKERAGSRPRCISFMHGDRATVAKRLQDLVNQPDVSFGELDEWMPRGVPIPNAEGTWDKSAASEAKLDKPNSMLDRKEQQTLRDWWLKHAGGANTPNWDIVSTCTVSERRSILLVEAKAHAGELTGGKSGKKLVAGASLKSIENHAQIGAAISDAATKFESSGIAPCFISRDTHYQMSNRFAFASKLAEMGYPVVLMYLGFLNAGEMDHGKNTILKTHGQWNELVRQHSSSLFPVPLWDRKHTLNGQPFYPLIRTIDWPIQP